jgi:hypothetical protein
MVAFGAFVVNDVVGGGSGGGSGGGGGRSGDCVMVEEQEMMAY